MGIIERYNDMSAAAAMIEASNELPEFADYSSHFVEPSIDLVMKLTM
jgi:hypothetical protein